jgi:hypothetical protein
MPKYNVSTLETRKRTINIVRWFLVSHVTIANEGGGRLCCCQFPEPSLLQNHHHGTIVVGCRARPLLLLSNGIIADHQERACHFFNCVLLAKEYRSTLLLSGSRPY